MSDRRAIGEGAARDLAVGGGVISGLIRHVPLAAGVAGMVVALTLLRQPIEVAVANLGAWLPVGYAFAAGMVASVNPCGFMLLPSYIAYQLGAETPGYLRQSALARLRKALGLALSATGGFLLVFATIGAGIAAGGTWLVNVFPYAGIAMGALMTALGTWLLVTRRSLAILSASRALGLSQRGGGGDFVYGMAYAVSSLGCTLPVFLVVVGSALSTGGFLDSVAQFVAYALGMGASLGVVAIGTALVREAMRKWMMGLVSHVHRAGALFLLGVGVYLIVYWARFFGFFG